MWHWISVTPLKFYPYPTAMETEETKEGKLIEHDHGLDSVKTYLLVWAKIINDIGTYLEPEQISIWFMAMLF